MSIYDINHDNQIVQNLPKNKRKSIWFWWLSALVQPDRWLYYTLFYVFKRGVNPPLWTVGTYTKGSVVKYAYNTYISLIDNNTETPPSVNWFELQSNHLGTDARVLFTANKLKLEYALNTYFDGEWFGCTVANSGDIWISNNEIETGYFRVGLIEQRSSSVGLDISSEPIGVDGAVLGAQYAYTVNVLQSIWDNLASTDEEREFIMRNFIDRYNIAGLFYNFTTY